jgi:hypothetical protein
VAAQAKKIESGEVTLNKAHLAETFRRRAFQLRVQAFSILGLIVVALGAAIWIFFSAAAITKQDVATDTTFQNSANIAARINDLEKKIPKAPIFSPTDSESNEYEKLAGAFKQKVDEFYSALEEINKEVLARVASGRAIVDRGDYDLTRSLKMDRLLLYPTLKEDSLYRLDSSYKTDNLVLFGALLGSKFDLIDALNTKFSEIEQLRIKANSYRLKVREAFEKAQNVWEESTKKERSEIDELVKGFGLVKEQETKMKFGLVLTPQEEKNISIPFLIQTNVTRFGPMLIILFFVNILVNLYRYCIRLSAYYDARSDTLALIDIGINPDSFQKYATSLSPDALDIAKPPKLPTEYAVDIAKAAVSKIGSGAKG